MPTLRALMIAIDNYPNPAHRLGGCVNDLKAMEACLRQCCTVQGMQFDPLILTDAAATRANVIKGFDHFKKAAPDDPCLFFYAGHGARSKAPEAFWHMQPDKEMESMVCYDSRNPGGHDLMDKELSYLIWRANEGKDLPFISIMDCCHSGQMRAVEIQPDKNMRERIVRTVGPALSMESFFGIDEYFRSDAGEISPPIGRRVHLGACRDTETAKEVRVFVEQRSQQRGLFSYCLIEAFQQNGFFIAYSDLLNRVQLRARVIRTDQSPQLTVVDANDKNLAFLSKETPPVQKSALVTFRKGEGWAVDVGAVHGLENGSELDKNIVVIPELDNRAVEIDRVLSNYSLLKTIDTQGKPLNIPPTAAIKVYTAIFQRLASRRIQIQAAADCDAAMLKAFQKHCEIKKSLLFQWNDQTGMPADLTLHAQNGAYQLRYAGGDRSLFGDIKGVDNDALSVLHLGIETV